MGKFYIEAEISGFSVRVGDGLQDVDMEIFCNSQVCFDQDPMIAVLTGERPAYILRGKGHQHIKIRETINGLIGEAIMETLV